MDEKEEAVAVRELEWLLSSLGETLNAVRSGLRECEALLNPNGPVSTLPLSSAHSECLKGIVTRTGSQITRADIQIKLLGLPHTRGYHAYKLALSPLAERGSLVLEQLIDVKNLIWSSLELLRLHEDQQSSTHQLDAVSAMERLCELESNVLAARTALKGASPHRLFPYHAADPGSFEPTLPACAAFDVYIHEASLVVEVRTLEFLSPPEPSRSGFSVPTLDFTSPFGFRERFAAAVGFRGPAHHISAEDEADKVFDYKGSKVKIREGVRVYSADPSLMAVWAKLGGLANVLGSATKSLDLVLKTARMAAK